MVLTRKKIWEFMRKKKKPKERKGLALLKSPHKWKEIQSSY